MKPSQLRARYWRIVSFFGRVTLGVIFWEIVIPRLGLRRLADRNRTARMHDIAARFRGLAIRMGGLMIKVGQFLSARIDVLPTEITDELAGLQDEVPAEPYEVIRVHAETDLALTLAEHYAYFDEEPLAAASLGQVHRARLREKDADQMGFTDVVVKIQRPHIEQIVEVDLAALRQVGQWLERYRPVRERADVPALIEEFATTTREEVDYLQEGSNAEAFAANFAGEPRVEVPRVVWELTTRRVLTLEDVSAIKFGDHAAITAAGIDRSEVARVLADTYLQQIFEDGLFHADPHPGNLFVTPLDTTRADGSRDWRLTFVDFGMVGRVPENLSEGFREMLIAVGTQDGGRLVRSFKTLDVLLPTADLDLIERASMAVFDRFGGMSMDGLTAVSHADMMNFGMQFEELMLDMPFQLPENVLLLVRCIAILSGMCTALDPGFNLWDAIVPYASSLISEEGGGSTFDTILAEGGKLLKTIVALPARADRVLTMAERGDLAVKTPMLELRVRRLERSVGRTTSAVLFAGLLVAGAVLHASDPTLGTVLMWISAAPALSAAFGSRGRHPGSS